MMTDGWTKCPRKLRRSELFHRAEDFRLYGLLASEAMVKDGVKCGGMVLRKGQYVRSISYLREDLWFYNGQKKEYYHSSKIKRAIKRLETHGLIKAVACRYGFIFTVLPVDDKEADGLA
ncbi:hypothetical protein LCM10_08220 [Rossellomorea aquimaris]|uniref:hypothetical protein n=1 Tax=Rossellomorea aquimaris TaxID=189382 RepID=UPI001CD6E3F8|nr:hypothetical protein [Rossellomorea aquimaris]MCA1054967.1 hypothetical protein [Rossellomorea aquimaris]